MEFGPSCNNCIISESLGNREATRPGVSSAPKNPIRSVNCVSEVLTTLAGLKVKKGLKVKERSYMCGIGASTET